MDMQAKMSGCSEFNFIDSLILLLPNVCPVVFLKGVICLFCGNPLKEEQPVQALCRIWHPGCFK